MKNRTIVCAIAAASLTLGSLPSFAQGNSNHGGRHDNGQHRGWDKQKNKHDDRDDGRHNDRDSRADNRRADHYYYNARGPEWRRGAYVPQQYRQRQYVVNDWRGHHLNAPPRGHQWVQVGGDYVLMAIATGVIVSLILSN